MGRLKYGGYTMSSDEMKMSTYKRTIREPDGTHTIIYQDNGWTQHIKEYDDGTREEWLEPEE